MGAHGAGVVEGLDAERDNLEERFRFHRRSV
jgi:hypothetical protein